MPDRLVVQPNGRFALFSPIVDDITIYNMTREEFIEQHVSEAVERARAEAEKWVDGPRPGRDHFTLERLRSEIVMVHGEKRYEQRVRQLSATDDDDPCHDEDDVESEPEDG